jgi:HK97 family phage major capsid protein
MLDRDLREDPSYLDRASYGQIRDAALRSIERRGAHLSPSAQDRLADLVRTRNQDCDGKIVARYILVTASDAYESAFAKSLTYVSPAFNPAEQAAVTSYREIAYRPSAEERSAGEGGSFGLAIPVMISPEVITGGALDDASIFSVARVVSTTTNVWKGVASTGGPGFSLPGEGVVVGDGSPAFTQPTLNIFTLSDFLPYSIEVGQDFPGFADEMTSVFKANYLDRVSKDTAQGAGGTSAPQGIFTGLVGVTSSTVHVTTSGTIGAVDVRKAWATLPERMRNDSSCAWAMSNSVWQQISALAAPSVTNGLAPLDVGSFADGSARLMGKPVIFSSYDPAFSGTTGAASYAVVGAFSRFAIAQRIAGVTVELVPQLRDVSTGRPTGSRGLLAYARYGSGVLDTASFVVLTN